MLLLLGYTQKNLKIFIEPLTNRKKKIKSNLCFGFVYENICLYKPYVNINLKPIFFLNKVL